MRKMTGASQQEPISLELLQKMMSDLAKERGRERFHDPRNLLLALVGEVGELSQIFQSKGEVPTSKGIARLERRGKGAPQLSDICGIDLQAALKKIQLDAIKFPANPSNPK